MSGLYLNYCFCKVSSDTEEVFAIDFADNSIRELRNKYEDYRFYRDGNQILYWTKAEGNTAAIADLVSTKVQISAVTHPTVVSYMLKGKIEDVFAGTDKYDLWYEKFTQNLIAKKKSAQYSDAALDLNACAKLSTYFFKWNDELHFGFSVSSNMRCAFKWSKQDFTNNGIDSADLFENREGVVVANTRAIARYKDARGLRQQIESVENNFDSKSGQFGFAKRVIDWLQKGLVGTLYNGIQITGCEINYLPYANIFPNEIISPPKKYYANDQIVGGLPSAALKITGPYLSLPDSTINIALVALRDNEGTLNTFTKRLSDEIKSLFRLNVNYRNYWVDSDNISSFSEAIKPISARDIDLVVFIVKKEQRYMPTKQSPYFHCKAKLIGQEIPTQCICIETIKRLNDFVLGNIALNIYAKFGGTAWGIEKKDTTKKELIIGIGSTVNWKNEKVVSIANVFESSGVYLTGACSPIIDYKNYSAELEKLLKELFATILKDEKEVHLIFHIFKSAGKEKEIKALENVIAYFSGVDIKYSFVQLGYGHNFRLFFSDGKNDLKKGQYICLNKTESLLIVNDKSTVPLKVVIDKRSNLKDIYYITQQAFFFAHLSVRSFIPSKKPITILYPSIMASLIEKLKLIDNWDYDKLGVKGVTEKLWFL